MRTCKRCHLFKPLAEFHRLKGGHQAHCKTCHNARTSEAWRSGTPEERAAKLAALRERSLRRKFGIGAAEYDAILERQGGVCRICQRPETSRHRDGRVRRLAVDHDHQTGRVRGLLCALCNMRLGHFESRGCVDGLLCYLREEVLA